jgi:hypothetical protein
MERREELFEDLDNNNYSDRLFQWHNLTLLSYRQQLASGCTKEAAVGAQPGSVFS